MSVGDVYSPCPSDPEIPRPLLINPGVHYSRDKDDVPEQVVNQRFRTQPAAGRSGSGSPWRVGKVLPGNYIIRDVLGRGGIGKVFLVARQTTRGPMYFAVKTLQASVLPDDGKRRAFQRELRTWIDLPEHPNLTACRFFRTIEDRLAIFAEFVDGGNLFSWIQKFKLIQVDRILDIAIQCARGLQAAHDTNVIHQDVKSSNVLMTRDGTAKLTDFGLARAWLASGAGQGNVPCVDARYISTAGMTLPYCSPEQSMGEKLTYRTDIWSYGITVMEMFCGSVNWQIGSLAPFILEKLKYQRSSPPFPDIPDSITQLLSRCFREDPDDRWDSMDEIAERLQTLYHRETGRKYPRKKPHRQLKTVVRKAEGNRGSDRTEDCNLPEQWLETAFREADKNTEDMHLLIPSRSGSEQIRNLVDLEIIGTAEQLFADLVAGGRTDQENNLAGLLHDKALIQVRIHDFPGALQTFERSIDMQDRLIRQNDSDDRIRALAEGYLGKATTLSRMGQPHNAMDIFNRINRLLAPKTDPANPGEFRDLLVRLHLQKSLTLQILGEFRSALSASQVAINLLMVFETGSELSGGQNELARVYMVTAAIHWQLGDTTAALIYYDKCIALRERRFDGTGRSHFATGLARAYMNKAVILSSIDDYIGAVVLLDKAIKIVERLVFGDGLSRLMNLLADAYMNKATTLGHLGDSTNALDMFNRVSDILENQIYQKGRIDLSAKLAAIFQKKAVTLCRFNRFDPAMNEVNSSIKIYSRLINQDQRTELRGELAWSQLHKARIMFLAGDREHARLIARKAIPVLKSEIKRTGRADLKSDFQDISRDLKSIMYLKNRREGTRRFCSLI